MNRYSFATLILATIVVCLHCKDKRKPASFWESIVGAKNGVWLQAEPEASSKKIILLPYGTKVQRAIRDSCIAVKGDWDARGIWCETISGENSGWTYSLENSAEGNLFLSEMSFRSKETEVAATQVAEKFIAEFGRVPVLLQNPTGTALPLESTSSIPKKIGEFGPNKDVISKKLSGAFTAERFEAAARDMRCLSEAEGRERCFLERGYSKMENDDTMTLFIRILLEEREGKLHKKTMELYNCFLSAKDIRQHIESSGGGADSPLEVKCRLDEKNTKTIEYTGFTH